MSRFMRRSGATFGLVRPFIRFSGGIRHPLSDAAITVAPLHPFFTPAEQAAARVQQHAKEASAAKS